MPGLPGQYSFMETQVIAAIGRPNFISVLPDLTDSSWDKVLMPTADGEAERERLEFMGDSFLQTAVTFEVCERYPQEAEHFYIITLHQWQMMTRVLLCNRVFFHFMIKYGVRHPAGRNAALSYNKLRDKVYGDAFEAIVGAYFDQCNVGTPDSALLAVRSWVSNALGSLIDVARNAYYDFSPRPIKKRLRLSYDW